MFKVLRLGYVNCDRFVGRRNKDLRRFNVTAFPAGTTILIYKSIRSLTPSFGEQGNLYFKNVPIGEPVVLVTMYEKTDGVYAIREDLTFDGNSHSMAEGKKMTKEEFKAFLKELNQIKRRGSKRK